MSDLAFNNYCIACDKLCMQNTIYCSDECKSVDETQSFNISKATAQEGSELVSPMLTPSLYQHYTPVTELNNSPLVLGLHPAECDLDYNQFDLNYVVNAKSSPTAASTADASKQNIIADLPSTSHNYRKWLTACL